MNFVVKFLTFFRVLDHRQRLSITHAFAAVALAKLILSPGLGLGEAVVVTAIIALYGHRQRLEARFDVEDPEAVKDALALSRKAIARVKELESRP